MIVFYASVAIDYTSFCVRTFVYDERKQFIILDTIFGIFVMIDTIFDIFYLFDRERLKIDIDPH